MEALNNRQNKRWMLLILMDGLALLMGGFIYILLRDNDFRFFRWVEIAGFGQQLHKIRADYFLGSRHFPEWFVYSLPEGLWVFAYSIIISNIWIGRHSWLSFFWIATIPLLPLGFEILQYVGVLPGTCCFTDMLSGLLGGCLGISIVYIIKNSPGNETEIL